MTITPLPTAPLRTMTQAAFDAAYAAWIAAQPTFIDEMNATAALLSAGSGMGAYAIAYTFSTTTTDSDPGNGVLRLNQATQNTATVIRADLLDSGGTTQTAVLDSFTSTAGTIKGYIRLVKTSDSTKWLLFSITAVASPSGYRNITCSNIGSSAASPFANSDAIMLYFTPLNTVNNSVGDHSVVVHTGNGHGSTNTKIRRFTTAMTNVGTAITYADSATLGATFTINETGMYAGTLQDQNPTNTAHIGISVNSSQLTTGIQDIAVANRVAYSRTGNDVESHISFARRFTAGDVVRVHSGNTLPDLATDLARFSITKIGF